jgi:hypothetical protein
LTGCGRIDIMDFISERMMTQAGDLSVYVKKPECPARKSGDEWPKWLFL